MGVHGERVYDFLKRNKKRNEYAVLIDRVWPRGIKKDDLAHDEWLKDIAPSSDLRKWFGHDEERWEQFQQRYRDELGEKDRELQRLKNTSQEKNLILLYAAKNEKLNQAVVLKEVIQS